MESFYDYVSSAMTKLQRAITSIEDLRFVMDCLRELKTKDSGIDHEVTPILDMYAMLSLYLPDGSVEMVRAAVTPSRWGCDCCERSSLRPCVSLRARLSLSSTRRKR